LYNYLRRDYNLTSYKLDYVSSQFIGDDVIKIEHVTNDKDYTIIYTKNFLNTILLKIFQKKL